MRCVSSYVMLGAAAAGMVQAGVARAATADTTASFSVATATEVPGATLKPGAYTIQMVDHLSDRTVVRMDSVSGSTHVTFLGVTAAGTNGETAHPVEWPEKKQGRRALRGFVFPNGAMVEFVYPKADAVALANANSATVVAIDPASEGRPELSKLTSTDMQMVNLWMLTPVRVGPGKGQKGIDARHYQPAVAAVQPPASTPAAVRGASTAAMASSSAPATQPPASGNAAVSAGRPTVQRGSPTRAMVARVEPPPQGLPTPRRSTAAVTRLPQTGSELPLVWLIGLLSMSGAAVLGARRVAQA